MALPEDIEVQNVTKARPLSVSGTLQGDEAVEVATRFGFLAISNMSYELHISVISKDCWQVKGQIIADISQACVVTGEPVTEHLDISIEERFVPTVAEHDEIDVDAAGVEALIEGKIPTYEVLVQSLALAANPYPRIENAPENLEFGPKIEKENPFSKLIQLKK